MVRRTGDLTESLVDGGVEVIGLEGEDRQEMANGADTSSTSLQSTRN
jgi:hypothetical protein